MRRVLPIPLLLLATVPLLAADEPKGPKEFAPVQYRGVGPYAGGRVSRSCGVPGDPLTYYAATASGGVWKSTDGGLIWKPIFDDQPTSSIGSIAVAASDPNVVYVGTGEANIRGNVAPGAGIFKSTDGGKTWKHVWKQVGQIGTMAVHPKNPDIAYAAVLGHAFGANPERGIYRTRDGGKTWEKVLFKNGDTGASDVCLDPSNPRVIFAGFWQARRKPWELTSGGPGSDLYVSRDGGDTWTSLRPTSRGVHPHGPGETRGGKPHGSSNGLPDGPWGKIGVAVAPSDSSRVYALIEAEKGGLFRSDDGGETWTRTSDNRTLRQRAWYYSTLTVHPTNPDVIYAPNVPLLKSIDGGHSFQPVRGCHHGDHHDLWIDPKNPERMIASNDGGLDLTTDGGKTWFAPPIPISQFYHVHADNSVPYRVMGCMQDLGSASGPSHSLTGGIGLGDWHEVGGGEAGWCVSDPSDPNIVYAGEYGGIMTRYDNRTKQSRNITINQWNPSGIDPAKHKYRFQWTAPILVSQHDPKTVYHAGNILFRTRDAGQTWEAVSKDLTRNDKHKQQWSGGPITGDNTGAETYCTIFAIGESPKQKGLIWLGTDDGKVWLTKDDCKTWTDLTANVPDLPDWGTVQCVEPSPHDAGTAFLVVDNHRMDDYRPHVWKTTDFGQKWEPITDGLDAGTHCHAVREDPKKKGVLYLGTEHGVMVSPDAGKSWKSLQLNLPTVPVHDLQVKGDDLVVGTHGRSIWILDDLTVIREWTDSVKEKPLHLFTVRPTTKWESGGGPVSSHLRNSSAANPPHGAVIWFHITKLPKDKDAVKLEVFDAKGKLVSKATGKPEGKDDKDEGDDEDEGPPKKKERTFPLKEGTNRAVWDLTHEGAEVIPGAVADSGNPNMGVPVSPGTYTIKLTVGKKSQEQKVDVKPDPRLTRTVTWYTTDRNGKGKQVEPGEPNGAKPTPADAKRIEDDIESLSGKITRVTISPDVAGLAAQEQLALKLRDDITKLSQTVLRIRALQKQIGLRKDLLKENDDAKQLLKDSEAFGKKLTKVEERLHNPKAKIAYDVFAAKGGAMLYSQLTWLLGNVTSGDGPPTKAMSDLAADLEKQLTVRVADFDKLTTDDLKKLNESAKKLGVPELYVPTVKEKKETDK